jgi:phosphohistidine phosphatase SixA
MRVRAPSCPGLMLVLLPALSLCVAATGPGPRDKQLIKALERGGYVILMRHATSPGTPPDPAQADADNVKHERQLDEAGRSTARAMGDAFQRLRIPIGEVLSSPTYRALETARFARFPTPQTFDELGDAGNSMSADTTGARSAWLRSRVAQVPKRGMDTVIITHYPNIKEAFADDANGLAEGEALIFLPDRHGAASLVARVKIEDWPHLASATE